MVDGLNLDGISSGIPTNQLIDQLMQYERIPVLSLEEDKSELQTEKNSWRDVNSRIDSLADKISDLKLPSTFNSLKAVSNNNNIASVDITGETSKGSYEITVKSVAQKHRLGSTVKVDEDNLLKDELMLSDVSGDISVNGTVITVSSDETLSSLKNKINEADTGLSTTIVDGRLVMESESYGVDNTITLTDNSNSLLSSLGLDGDLNNIGNDAVLQLACDAEVEVNGIGDITSSNNTFTDIIDGLTFTINSEAVQDESAIITVSEDIESATSAVQNFVDQYNSVMNFIDNKLDYNSETENAGILQGDGTLIRLQMRIRSLLTESVNSSSDYNQIAVVGITVDREGIMSLDSSKFEEAVSDNSEAVAKLFSAESDSDDFDGVAVRLDSYIEQLIQSNTGVIPRRLEFYDTRIDSIDDSIGDFEHRLQITRERYIEQFTAMEKAISEMQAQGNWLISQLSGLNNSGLLSGTGGGQ